MADDPLTAFDEKLAKANIYGQWTGEKLFRNTDGPQPAGAPCLWKWAEVRSLLDEAAEVMPESHTARRSLMFDNPGLPRGTTHTMAMGMQLIRPGETAWTHRHSIAALRFTIEGAANLYTVVDGEPYPMEDNDLVLTPGWTWHDHHNESDKPAIWLDVRDVPRMGALNQVFYESFGEDRQPLADESGAMTARLGTLRPAWEARPTARVAVRYPWKDAEAQLRRLAGADAPLRRRGAGICRSADRRPHPAHPQLLSAMAQAGPGIKAPQAHLERRVFRDPRPGPHRDRRHRDRLGAAGRFLHSQLGLAPPHEYVGQRGGGAV